MNELNMIEKVYDFQKLVRGVNQPESPRALANGYQTARSHFLREELDEFDNAKTASEQLDALYDLIYFAIGGMYDMGLTEADAFNGFNRVHIANMTKRPGNKPGRHVDTADAVKPTGWSAPKFYDLFE